MWTCARFRCTAARSASAGLRRVRFRCCGLTLVRDAPAARRCRQEAYTRWRPRTRSWLPTTAAVPVVWDPHPRGPAPVRGCTLVTPNADEARLFSGVDSHAEQGRQLCVDWDAWSVAVTIGGRGAVLTEASDPPRSTHVPLLDFPKLTSGRLDTLGAGDQFAVAAVLALLDGADVREAVQAAVVSAAQFVH